MANIEDGIVWTENQCKLKGWDSDNGNFRIIIAKNGKHRLISFIHEDDDGEFRWWDFATLEQAKLYAEQI